jgi:mono/diheme cytochrome c family protein
VRANVLFFLILLATSGVPRANGQERRSDALLLGSPATERARKNPYADRDEAKLAGRKLFQRHCVECHGDAGIGTSDTPSLQTQVVRSAAPGTLLRFLKNGNLTRGMPSWSRLPDAQLWQIITYLDSIGK